MSVCLCVCARAPRATMNRIYDTTSSKEKMMPLGDAVHEMCEAAASVTCIVLE
jgi:hypothetical protein